MGWNLGRYYTRSYKVDGHIYREYVGGGETGRLAAQHDQERREKIRLRREAARRVMADLKGIDETVITLCHRTDLAAQAAMCVSGHYLHHRSEWRKRRVP